MKKSIASRLVWVGAFVTACAAWAYFFGAQTFFALQARRIGRQVPIVKSVPRELEDLSVAQSKGEKLSFEGAKFEVPWDDLDEGKTRTVGNCALMVFRSSNSVILCVGPADGFMRDLFRNKTAEPELFARIYGNEVLHSDYALMKAIYQTTPDEISLSTPPNQAAGLASVILIKAIAPPATDATIYNIRSGEFQGFQLGNPSHHPVRMCLQLYADDIEFEFSFERSKTGPPREITQADLNRIIQTAHKAAHAQSVLAVDPG